MNRLDSIKILLPINEFKDFNLNRYKSIESNKKCNGNTIEDKVSITQIDHGFKSLIIDSLKDEVSIEVSAKILKDNYYDGISLDTFDRLHYEIESTGVCSINSDKLIKAKVLRGDPCVNLETSNLKRSVNTIINYGSVNSLYTLKHYKDSKNCGYEAVRNVKTYKERQIGYSKLHELTNKAAIRKFAMDHPKAISRFTSNTLRVEQNITSFKRMRHIFGVADNNLQAILQSNKNPNHNLFTKITSKGFQMDLFKDKYENMSVQQIVKEKGYEGVINSFNGDLCAIEKWIKIKHPRTKTSNPAAYQIKLFRQAYQRIIRQTSNESKSIILEIEELLKAS